MFLSCLSLAIVATLAIRFAPLLVLGRPELTTGDVINHLNLIDALRENRRRVPNLHSKFLLAGAEDYPTFYHQLLSYLPRGAVDWLEPILGSLVEAVHAVLIFFAAYLAAAYHLETPQPALVAMAATLMFAATPLHLGIENHGRVLRLSPRPFGVLLTAAAFLGGVQYSLTGSSSWLLLSGIAVGISIWASKFAVQALVLIGAPMAVFTREPQMLLMMPLGVLVGGVLSRGQTFRILAGSFRHSHFYCTWLRYRTGATKKYTIGNLAIWPITLLRCPRKAVMLLATHYIFISFTLIPWSILLAATYLVHPNLLSGMESIEHALLAWVLGGYLAMALTSMPWLRFLGEASRYITHCSTPICILAASRTFVLNDPLLWWTMAACTAAAIAGVCGHYVVNSMARQSDPDRAALYAWIKQQPASTLLTVHLRLSFLLCFRTPHRAVNWHTNAPTGERLAAFKRLVPTHYPWPDTNLDWIVEKYGVDLLVVDSTALETVKRRDPDYTYDFTGFDEVWSHGRFRALRPRQVGAKAGDPPRQAA